MKNSWTQTFRRLATAGCAAGAATFSSAMCYAINAFDSASDPAYNDGWQAGDNGGTGFTPWNFDAGYIFNGINYAYANAGLHTIDDGLQTGSPTSNPFNNIGQAWRIATTPNDDGAPHIGRGFAPLQVGQTLSVVIDNPTKREFFKGYFVRLNGNTGGANGNICNGGNGCSFPLGTPVPKTGIDIFNYTPPFGQWAVNDSASTLTGVFDIDTAADGALIQVKRTGGDNYDVLLKSLGGGASFSASRTFASPGAPVDWIEFVFFNPPTDTAMPPTEATDLYISSMQIVPEPGCGVLLVLGASGILVSAAGPRRRRGRA